MPCGRTVKTVAQRAPLVTDVVLEMGLHRSVLAGLVPSHRAQTFSTSNVPLGIFF